MVLVFFSIVFQHIIEEDCEKNDRIMLRLCYQTQDAICDTFDNHDNLYPFDKSISLNNTNNIFENSFFQKTFFSL